MVDSEHINIFEKGIEYWNEWRESLTSHLSPNYYPQHMYNKNNMHRWTPVTPRGLIPCSYCIVFIIESIKASYPTQTTLEQK